ncbi:MAG: type I-C CRISPR-associated protein Cas7/Csd2 [Lentisphaeria bacterium]|nr:type I-C CRISPR-associated protein Cas7/Csd2 [Lentisphaeria bacterium]
MSLTRKIDFAVVFSVSHANPNGDPLNGNRPRTTYEGYGEVSDVCLKRKLRDRLQDAGEAIFVQSDDRKTDGFVTLKQRADAMLKNIKDKDTYARTACETWFDVRAFGQVFAFKKGGKDEGADAVSCGIRGPVTVQSAFSLKPVDVASVQITKSVSNEGDGTKRSADTMGMKHRVDSGVYCFFGAMSPQLAEKTGFSDEDAAKIKALLPKLFENDASSARPDGSMRVLKVVWWEHDCANGRCSSARVHDSLKVNDDGTIEVAPQEGIRTEVLEGF